MSMPKLEYFDGGKSGKGSKGGSGGSKGGECVLMTEFFSCPASLSIISCFGKDDAFHFFGGGVVVEHCSGLRRVREEGGEREWSCGMDGGRRRRGRDSDLVRGRPPRPVGLAFGLFLEVHD